MAFDPDTEFMIELDASSGIAGDTYSQNLQYIMDLAQRSAGPSKKDFVATNSGTDLETNVQSGITGFKERNPAIGFIASFTTRDMSNLTFLQAIDSGDISASNLNRFNNPPIRGVDTGADEVTVEGDQRQRIESGNSIVITDSTGNDGIYVVDTVSYDSGADETTLGVTGDLTDGTVDGSVLDGVKDTLEQRVWLQEFVHDGRFGDSYILRGQEFEDSAAGGRTCVLKEADIERTAERFGSARGFVKTGEGSNVAGVV